MKKFSEVYKNRDREYFRVRKDFWLSVLEFASSQPGGFTKDELYSELKLSDYEKEVLGLYINGFGRGPFEASPYSANNDQGIFVLSYSGTQFLLELTELKEARKASRVATQLSVAAILLSALAILTAVALSFTAQRSRIVTIDEEVISSFYDIGDRYIQNVTTACFKQKEGGILQ